MEATEGPNLSSRFHLSSPFYTPVLSPLTVHITTTCDIITTQKKLPKTGHILGIRNLYTHTVIASKYSR